MTVSKRVTDVTVVVVALAFLLPLLFVVAAMVKLCDGGPVFYRQERVGRDGRLFTILKFRSMSTDSDELRAGLVSDKGLFKLVADPRVTRVGHVLRRYSLDEIPQLWNVLRGDMSLVGPRPALPEEVAGYSLPELRRLSVAPGLSGLWQVSGRSDLSREEGMRLDLLYVESWSFVTDLVVLARTPACVLAGRGAY